MNTTHQVMILAAGLLLLPGCATKTAVPFLPSPGAPFTERKASPMKGTGDRTAPGRHPKNDHITAGVPEVLVIFRSPTAASAKTSAFRQS